MKRLDLSFLDPEPDEGVQEPVCKVAEEADRRDLLPATVQELQTDQTAIPAVEVSPWPRTNGEWQVLLSKLKKEKEATWQEFDRQRGIDLAYRMQSAKLETIKAARAEIPVLRKRVASVRRRLSSWGWCPLRKVPLLPCHIGYKVGATGQNKRLWTKRQSDQYFQLLLSILLEQLSSAEHVACLQPCTRYKNGKYEFSKDYILAETKFETANQAYQEALKQAEDFNRNGPSSESRDVEIARRLAKYESASYGSQFDRIEPDSNNSSSSSGGSARSHRPQVNHWRPKC